MATIAVTFKKSIFRLKLMSIFSIGLIFTSIADGSGAETLTSITPTTDNYQSPTNATLSQILSSLNNFGAYMGFNLAPGANQSVAIQPIQLLASTLSSKNPVLAATLLLGTLIETTIVDPNPSLNANSAPQSAAILNKQINMVFPNGAYSNIPSINSLSYSPFIDQPPYVNDPISQNIIDMLSTYDPSFCTYFQKVQNGPSQAQANLSPYGTPLITTSCSVMNTSTIAQHVLLPVNEIANGDGSSPPINANHYLFLPTSATDPQMNLIPQLNSNSLIEPMMYSTTSTQSNTSPPAPQTTLTAATQAQLASNFIRYVSSAVAPSSQIDYPSFAALTTSSNPESQASVATYFANLRSYAALISVGTSNLYYMLSRRMPQTQTVPVLTPNCTPSSQNSCQSTETVTTSEALNDYLMATKRNYDPSGKTDWKSDINNASEATVQKEMAILLSEINYQLYLSRQQQERLLLTNTMLLFQVSRLVAPTPPKSSPMQ